MARGDRNIVAEGVQDGEHAVALLCDELHIDEVERQYEAMALR